VSIWIGMLPADDFKSLLVETYGTERPISQLARDLGLHFYDHDFLESVHHTKPRLARDAIAQLSFAEGFIAQLPDAFATQLIDTVVVMYAPISPSARPTLPGSGCATRVPIGTNRRTLCSGAARSIRPLCTGISTPPTDGRRAHQAFGRLDRRELASAAVAITGALLVELAGGPGLRSPATAQQQRGRRDRRPEPGGQAVPRGP